MSRKRKLYVRQQAEREQRKMRTSKLDRRLYVILAGGVTFMLLGSYTAVATFYGDNRMRVLDNAGTLTTGEVESTHFYPPSSRGGPTYIVSYRFVDAQGISHEGKTIYPFQDGNRLGPGAQISVTYLAEDPQQNSLTQPLRKLIADRGLKEEMILILVFIIPGCFCFWAAGE